MSGAGVQTAGQVRNIYPYLTYRNIGASFTVINAGSAIQSPVYSDVVDTFDIPFDYGPDKAGRVFIVINGVGITVTGGTYQANDRLIANLYFVDSNGQNHLLYTFSNTIIGFGVFSPIVICPLGPLFSNKINRIGQVLFENKGSIITTAASQTLEYKLNIGYYGDFAEYDFDKLIPRYHKDPDVDLTVV